MCSYELTNCPHLNMRTHYELRKKVLKITSFPTLRVTKTTEPGFRMWPISYEVETCACIAWVALISWFGLVTVGQSVCVVVWCVGGSLWQRRLCFIHNFRQTFPSTLEIWLCLKLRYNIYQTVWLLSYLQQCFLNWGNFCWVAVNDLNSHA